MDGTMEPQTSCGSRRGLSSAASTSVTRHNGDYIADQVPLTRAKSQCRLVRLVTKSGVMCAKQSKLQLRSAEDSRASSVVDGKLERDGQMALSWFLPSARRSVSVRRAPFARVSRAPAHKALRRPFSDSSPTRRFSRPCAALSLNPVGRAWLHWTNEGSTTAVLAE